jgi:hypothetical protein
MALGEALRQARLERKRTPSEVAAAIRATAQMVAAIEREDFSKFAASIYARGFIRLYAQHVGLDPRPLVEEYNALVAAPGQPAREAPAQPSTPAAAAQAPAHPDLLMAESAAEPDLFAGGRRRPTPPAEGAPRTDESAAPAGALSRLRGAARAFGARFRRAGGALAAKSQELAESVREGRVPAPELSVPTTPLKILSLAVGILVLLLFVVSGLSRCVRRPARPAAADARPAVEEATLAVEPPDVYVE